jgi:hypothetical protein
MFYSIDQFKKNTDEETIELSLSIPITSLFPPRADRSEVDIESGYTIFYGDVTPVFQKTRILTVHQQDDSSVYKDFFLQEFSFDLIRTEADFTLHARIPESNTLNGWRFTRDIRLPNRERLSLSTLKLAYDISPIKPSNRRHRDGLKIVPNPSKRFDIEDPIYVYYEIYDLVFNDRGSTNYTVDFSLTRSGRKGFVKRVMGMFGSGNEYQISLQSVQEGDSRTESDYIVFDMSKLRKGDYELTLEVTDNVIGERAKTRTDILLQ